MPYTPNDASPLAPKPTVLAWLRDRRVIAINETNSAVLDPSSGGVTAGFAGYGGNMFYPLWAQLPDLRNVEWVLDINVFSDPGAARDVCIGGVYNKKISGNIVGFTVVGITNVPSGTTIFAEVVAIGPP